MATAAQTAKSLAEQVTGATTPAAQYMALCAVMQALGVAVYDSRGKAIVPLPQGAPEDRYLYDFELRSMAFALRMKWCWGTDVLAEWLTGIRTTMCPAAASGSNLRGYTGPSGTARCPRHRP